ncbi:hypothetical protein AB0395_26575 [Streptosporangium sp. NPDC051023]|uniref:hypothetical protein n=1 Tax=Streptosporangium sp. NPDC051023 TaxID=3155410 RepID=UPI00344EDFA0
MTTGYPSVPRVRWIDDEVLRARERSGFVVTGVDLEARKTFSLDEEEDTVVASTHIGGDQHSVSCGSVGGEGLVFRPEVDRRASASATAGHDCRSDLSPELVHTGEVLGEKGQNHSLFFRGEVAFAGRHVTKISNRLCRTYE